jgi:hypothetical protein
MLILPFLFYRLGSSKAERVAVNYKDVGSNPALSERRGSLTVESWFSMPLVQVQVLPSSRNEQEERKVQFFF